jgi:hypothetical protein
MPTLDPQDLPEFTRADVAAQLCVTERQIARWTSERKIAVVYMGTSPRYTPRAVAEFIARSTKPAEDGAE